MTYPPDLTHINNALTKLQVRPDATTLYDTAYGSGPRVFGAGWLYLAGSTDYLSWPDSADWNMSAFTIELTVVFLATPSGNVPLVAKGSYASHAFWLGVTGSALIFRVNSASADISRSFTPVLGVQYHIVAQRDGSGNISLCIDGALQGSTYNYTAAVNDTAHAVELGHDQTSVFVGACLVSELRISNVARYTTPFVFPQVVATSDANTMLLCHFTGLHAGTTFTDSSSYARTATRGGSAKTVTGKPFTTTGSPTFSITDALLSKGLPKALYVDGTGDYFSWASDTLTTNTWAVEGWFYIVGPSVAMDLFGWVTDGSNYTSAALLYSGGKYMLRMAAYASGAAAWVANMNSGYILNPLQWYHIAIVRYGTAQNNLKIMVNGADDTTWSTNLTAGFSIPSYTGFRLSSNHWQGYPNMHVGPFRVSVGTSRGYESGFTPATSWAVDSYTKVQLDGQGYGSSVLDSAGVKTVTANGDAKLAYLPPGKAAVTLSGSGQYFSVPDMADFKLGATTPWTLDAWIKTGAATANQVLFSKGYTTAGDISARLDASYKPCVTVGGNTLTAASALPVGVWRHLAIVCDGSTVVMYVDGLRQTGSIAAAAITSTALAIIGYSAAGGVAWNGQISGFRWSPGLARWRSNFTPPRRVC